MHCEYRRCFSCLQIQVITFNVNENSMLKVKIRLVVEVLCTELKVLFKFCFFIFSSKHTLNVYCVIGKQVTGYIKINEFSHPQEAQNHFLSVGMHACMCMCMGKRMVHVNK